MKYQVKWSFVKVSTLSLAVAAERNSVCTWTLCCEYDDKCQSCMSHRGVLNHRKLGWSFSSLFRRTTKKISRSISFISGSLWRECTLQKANDAEIVSMSSHYHGMPLLAMSSYGISPSCICKHDKTISRHKSHGSSSSPLLSSYFTWLSPVAVSALNIPPYKVPCL